MGFWSYLPPCYPVQDQLGENIPSLLRPVIALSTHWSALSLARGFQFRTIYRLVILNFFHYKGCMPLLSSILRGLIYDTKLI